MMMGSSSAVGGSNSWRMLKLTASILSILFVMMILWSNGGSNDNDIDSTATTMPRQLSSLQQFMDPKSTNLRSEIVGGVIPPASVYIDQDTSTRNGVGQFKYLPKGKWIKGRSSEHAAPICCGWDDGHYLKVPECGTVPMPRVNGGWRGRPDFYAQLGGHGCTCKNFKDDYEWSETPSSSWNAYDTCKKLNGRRVLLIGDSTMSQLGTTLMNALHPAGCQINITCVEIDTLVNKEMGALNRGPHWMDSVKQNEGWADIVIISAGPHIYGRANFNLVVDSVINGTRTLKNDYPNMEVVWKTQPPAGCTSEPTTAIEFSGDYQYNEFYERDVYCLNELPRHGIHVLDMRMLYYRGDAHIHSGHSGIKEELVNDCLHMCVPGPLDIIAPLFSELLDQL